MKCDTFCQAALAHVIKKLTSAHLQHDVCWWAEAVPAGVKMNASCQITPYD